MKPRTGIVLVVALLSTHAASAQTGVVSNPTTVQFDHAGYATTARYELGYFALSIASGACDTSSTPASSPTATDAIAVPSGATGAGMTGALSARPVGCYVAKVRALDTSGLVSAWSDPSNPFATLPVAPSSVAVSRR